MTQPHEQTIRDHSNGFRRLGLTMTANTDDFVIFSDGSHSIKIATERYYPLDLTIGITDTDGSVRALSLLEETIDPSMSSQIRAKIQSFIAEHSLEQKNKAEMLEDGSLQQYISLELTLALEFLIAHKNEVFDMPEELKTAYESNRKATLEHLGLRSLANLPSTAR